VTSTGFPFAVITPARWQKFTPEKQSCEDLIVSIHHNSNLAGLRQQ
jgi:hypothetical protein